MKEALAHILLKLHVLYMLYTQWHVCLDIYCFMVRSLKNIAHNGHKGLYSGWMPDGTGQDISYPLY